MADSRAPGILAVADELQRRDEIVAAELEELDALAAAAALLRAAAAEIGDALDAIPVEAAAVERSLDEARRGEADVLSELEAAESRLAGIEAARRRKPEDVEQARRAVTTAREAATDARHRVERLLARRLQLRDEEHMLRERAETLLAESTAVAARIRSAPRVMDAAKRDPGGSLDELEAWGGQTRAALFVARGTAETERERIVQEASALVASVLGEVPAGASVALARRRLTEALEQ